MFDMYLCMYIPPSSRNATSLVKVLVKVVVKVVVKVACSKMI